MARARMLSGSISNSARLASLSCDGARLLFTWMIPHADNLGRLRGEPIQVKATVLPRNLAKVEHVDKWLGELAKSGLITWYIFQDQRFIHIDRWGEFQKLHHTYSVCSELPDPQTCEQYVHRDLTVGSPLTNGGLTKNSRNEVEYELEGEVEGEVECEARKSADHVSVAQWFDEVFWPLYPRRKHTSKSDARVAMARVFAKLDADAQDRLGDLILIGVQRYAQAMSGTEPQYILHSATWINRRLWETADEPTPGRT